MTTIFKFQTSDISRALALHAEFQVEGMNEHVTVLLVTQI